MKIGLILQHYDRRNDVRKLVALLSEQDEVVLFCRPRDIHLADDALEARLMVAARNSIRNRVWNGIYSVFGNLPKCEDKFYQWKRRSLASERSKAGLSARVLLEFATRLPTIIDFDRYLRHLDFVTETKVDDIDVFFSFTDVNDPYFLAQIASAGKPLVTYLYSWDHPGKYHRFSRSWIKYLTWNDALEEDLINLHGVAAENIRVVGSSQLCYVEEFVREYAGKHPSPFPFDYIYFGAAAGYEKVTVQEVRLIRLVADTMASALPSIKLVVRPYPIGGVFDYYAELRELPNVVIEDYREPDQEMMFSEDGIVSKLNAIQHAKAFVHIGSTLGIEASYFQTPVVHLAIGDCNLGVEPDNVSSIHRLIHTFHAERYMLKSEYPNVVTSCDDLAEVLYGAVNQPQSYLDYNRRLASETRLLDFDTLASRIKNVLAEAAAGPEKSTHPHPVLPRISQTVAG